MECSRSIIYFSVYRNGSKAETAGHAVLWQNGAACRLEYHYRAAEKSAVTPVYYFVGGASITGEPIAVNGRGMECCVKTSAEHFLGSEKKASELEAIWFQGTEEEYSGGRLDGQELCYKNGEEERHPVQVWMDRVTDVMEDEAESRRSMEFSAVQTERKKGAQEAERDVQAEAKKEVQPEEERQMTAETSYTKETSYTLPELLSVLPKLSLPPDGVRRQCCRMELADFKRFPKKWQCLEKNHFLLHGYYRYHHLLLAQVCGTQGEQYVLGVPGEFYYRDQYMAESFGFSTFAPLQKGNRRRGEFGYWYLYLK